MEPAIEGAAAARLTWPSPASAQVDVANGLWFRCKWVFDLAGASILFLLLWPLMLLIAVLIKLDSSGPVLFVQQRMGSRLRRQDGRLVWELRTFPFYKFRSMVRDASALPHQIYIRNFCRNSVTAREGNTKFKLSNDPRVTRMGKLLRRTSLDELPQLLNVIKGDMSLVGPRPVPLYEVAMYEDRHYERLKALPGITGLWQVKGRCQVPFEDMVHMDIEYARNCSLWLDLKILLLTIPAVFSGRGAE